MNDVVYKLSFIDVHRLYSRLYISLTNLIVQNSNLTQQAEVYHENDSRLT